jgi:hypothetical protein
MASALGAQMTIWLLLIITSAGVDRVTYGSQELCEKAANIINEQSTKAHGVCIPADPYSMIGGDEDDQQ